MEKEKESNPLTNGTYNEFLNEVLRKLNTHSLSLDGLLVATAMIKANSSLTKRILELSDLVSKKLFPTLNNQDQINACEKVIDLISKLKD